MVADERICIWGTERYILSEKEMENGRSQDNNVIRGMVKDIHFKLPRKNYKYPKMLGKFVPPQYNNVEKSWALEDKKNSKTYAFYLSFNYHITYSPSY